MTENDLRTYEKIRAGGAGFIEMPRGLIAVWGKEAVQFLDGMITNDVKTLEDNAQMLAAFPNAQGRLLAVVRILRQGGRFLIETEEATREKVYQNLFRFTFAGDFFVGDISDNFRYFELFNTTSKLMPTTGTSFASGGSIGRFEELGAMGVFADAFRDSLLAEGAIAVNEDIYETFRIESGIPKYGVDMDETTIVPELGLDGLISYNKGCYIGQEIIARIHFRGHVAKRLTGLVAEAGGNILSGTEVSTLDGKNAGRITSVTFSPKLERNIGLAFVRYDYLAAGTELNAGDASVRVTDLPFFR